jgi:hypothetical protein
MNRSSYVAIAVVCISYQINNNVVCIVVEEALNGARVIYACAAYIYDMFLVCYNIQ